MAHIHRKYIDSHCLIFVIKGVLSLLLGLVLLFIANSEVSVSISITGLFLLLLSVIEFFNALYRAHNRSGWLISVLVAMFDSIAALFLLFTLGEATTTHLIILSVYAFIRGLSDIIIGFRTTVDPTDRFIWVVAGICGAVMAFAILNSTTIAVTPFVRFFGVYLIILGLSSLIYGIHNHSQKLEDHEARLESARQRSIKSAKAKKSTSVKKSSKSKSPKSRH